MSRGNEYERMNRTKQQNLT